VTRRSAVDLDVVPALFPDRVATRAQLIKLGVDPATISRRCQADGRWRRLLPGVVLMSDTEPNRRQLVRASLLRTGPLTVVTGMEAAYRHGVRRIPADRPVHILIPHGMRVGSRGFLLVERSRRAWDKHVVDGIPLAGPARALIDGARRERRTDIVRAMIADALNRGVCQLGDLHEELCLPRLRGTALPRRVLTEVNDGVRSAAEAWARSLVRRSDLPPPEWNVAIRTASGVLLGVADAWWEEAGLAWEIDSREFHLSPADYERTMARHSAMVAAGIMVVHTTPARLKRDAAAVIKELRGAYEFARSRPLPSVLTELWRPSS
jgi:hypothetical protein